MTELKLPIEANSINRSASTTSSMSSVSVTESEFGNKVVVGFSPVSYNKNAANDYYYASYKFIYYSQ